MTEPWMPCKKHESGMHRFGFADEAATELECEACGVCVEPDAERYCNAAAREIEHLKRENERLRREIDGEGDRDR